MSKKQTKEIAREILEVSFLSNRKMHEENKNNILSIPKIFLLNYLIDFGPRSMQEIASYHQIVLPAASVFVDDIEKQGYVIREKNLTDRRVVLVKITDQGRKIVKKEFNCIRKRFELLLNKLTKKEQNDFLRITNKLYRDINKKDTINQY